MLKRVKKHELVKGLSRRELVNPEGPGFDLRAGEIYSISGRGFLGKKERQTAKIKLEAGVKARKKKIIIKPGDYYLITTMEEIRMGDRTLGHIYPRSTLFRSGIQLLCGKVAPGYYGKLTFGIKNAGKVEFELELGARVAYMIFFEVRGRSNASRGQWRGGRIAAEKKERQI